MWGGNDDHATYRRIRSKEEYVLQRLAHLCCCVQFIEGNVSNDVPELVSTFNSLSSRNESAHAMANKDQLVESGRGSLWIDRHAHLLQVLAYLCGADPERLTGRVKIKPKLIILATLWQTAQIVKYFHPCPGARLNAVYHQHGDLLLDVWFELTQTAEFLYVIEF